MAPWLTKRLTGRDSPSVIGSDVRIRGRIDSEGELAIYGCVEGDIVHRGRLTIGTGASCVSNIQAEEMELGGEVRGNVQVQGTLVIRGTARLFGDTWCQSLQIEQGAIFSGANHMGEEIPSPAPAPVVTLAVSEPVELPAPLAILAEPVQVAEREVLVPPKPESPAFYGGFAPTFRASST